MSTSSLNRPVSAARAEAEAFRALFAPSTYARWEFAGSVRRRCALVGDVEHVVIPAFGEVVDAGDLFATPRRANLLFERLDELVRGGAAAKHIYGGADVARGTYTPTSFRWGGRYRGVDYRGACHEIFCADADNWGATLAIRTGPGSYSKMLVVALQRNGCCNSGGYVWDKRDMTCAGCGWRGAFVDLAWVDPCDWPAGEPRSKWINGHDRLGECPSCGKHEQLSMARVSVPEERDYFARCGIAFQEPWQRREQS
jgi:hypothetical protein